MIGHVLSSMNEVITNEYTNKHQAIDIVSNDYAQTDIINLESGIVEEVVKNISATDHTSTGNATYGNYVKIKQNNGKSALYAHMKYGSVNVNVGDYVEKGAIIGTMGSTGNAYGNHLHLEIKNENGVKENPIIELNKVNEEPKETKSEENLIEENTEETKSEENLIEENTKETKNDTKIEESPKDYTKIEENIKAAKERTANQKKTKDKIDYLSNQTYNNGSIVDGLKEIDIDSSYDYREKLAEKNNIQNYHGTYEQNVQMLKMLKEGKLIKA